MRIQIQLKVIMWVAILVCMLNPAYGADLVIQNQTINMTKTFDSAESLIFDNVVAAPPAKIRAIANYEIILRPGVRIKAGAYFVAENRDNDGLPNRWEIEKCQTLDHSAADDPDNDDLTMSAELKLNTHPCNPDTDNDDMPDGWEVKHGFNPLKNDANGDADGDGLSNLGEYLAGTDPHNSDTDGDGMPDGWEVENGTNPLFDDADEDKDGDDFSNIKEYHFGSKANDPNSMPRTFSYTYDDNGNLTDMTDMSQ